MRLPLFFRCTVSVFFFLSCCAAVPACKSEENRSPETSRASEPNSDESTELIESDDGGDDSSETTEQEVTSANASDDGTGADTSTESLEDVHLQDLAMDVVSAYTIDRIERPLLGYPPEPAETKRKIIDIKLSRPKERCSIRFFEVFEPETIEDNRVEVSGQRVSTERTEQAGETIRAALAKNSNDTRKSWISRAQTLLGDRILMQISMEGSRKEAALKVFENQEIPAIRSKISACDSEEENQWLRCLRGPPGTLKLGDKGQQDQNLDKMLEDLEKLKGLKQENEQAKKSD